MRHDEQSFPITTRILAAWPRFREATTDRDEAAIVEWCRLTRLETVALAKLRDQWQNAGPLEEWFEGPGGLDLKPDLLPALLDGFDWRIDLEAQLVRSFAPRTAGEEYAITQGLAAERKRREMRPGTEARIDRLAELIERRGIDLNASMSADIKQSLASAMKVSVGILTTTLAALRQRSDEEHAAEAPEPEYTQTNGRCPIALLPVLAPELPTPADPVRAAILQLRDLLLEEGLKTVKPESLREPLGLLARSIQ